MATLHVHDATAKQLSKLAAAAGMSVEDYLQSLLPSKPQPTALTADELEKLLDAESIEVPPLPDRMSAEDFYANHD